MLSIGLFCLQRATVLNFFTIQWPYFDITYTFFKGKKQNKISSEIKFTHSSDKISIWFIYEILVNTKKRNNMLLILIRRKNFMIAWNEDLLRGWCQICLNMAELRRFAIRVLFCVNCLLRLTEPIQIWLGWMKWIYWFKIVNFSFLMNFLCTHSQQYTAVLFPYPFSSNPINLIAWIVYIIPNLHTFIWCNRNK